MDIKLMLTGLLLFLVVSCNKTQELSHSSNPVVGAWRAGAMELSTGDSSWSAPYANKNQVIVFSSTGLDSGYYSKMGVSKERKDPFTGAMADPQKWDTVPRSEWNEAKAYLLDTFYGNAGTYTISGDTITRHREFARNQKLVGVSAKEMFKIDGDTMTVINEDTWWVDTTKTLTTTVVWTRIK